jgi:hypothetical protein
MEKIGTLGHSEDESDPESTLDDKKYYSKDPIWRSLDLQRFVRSVDRASDDFRKQRMNYRKGVQWGAHKRTRITSKAPRDPDCHIPRGLPINCYDSEWYSKQDAYMREWIGAKSAMPLNVLHSTTFRSEDLDM